MEDIEKLSASFDILCWCMEGEFNQIFNIIFFQIARDMLAILITIVASESTLNTRRCVLSHF